MLVFPGQRLTDEQQMAFTTRFGRLETTIKSIGQERRLHENMVDLSNVDPKTEDRRMGWNDRRMLYQSGNQLWHTDVYTHRWTQLDLVMWDNRAVLHRGRPWDAAQHRRVMRRTTLAGEGPTADPPYATRTPAWDGLVPEGGRLTAVPVQRRTACAFPSSALPSPCWSA